MSKKISIAIDAMGGDNSPDKTIEGIQFFLEKNKKNNDFILNIFGKEDELRISLEKYKVNSTNIQIINSDTVVSDKEKHLVYVSEILENIKNKTVEKVVATRKKEIPLTVFDLSELIRRIISMDTAAFRYVWFHPKTGIWCGASPEVLLECDGANFSTMALAGTQKITKDTCPTWGVKETFEQQLVTKAITTNLKKITTSLQVSSPTTQKAGSLYHIKTQIKGTFDNKQTSLAQIASVLHPTPAVCGSPKDHAFSIIQQLEGYDREFYTGFLGPLNLQSNTAQMYVNLRCMKISPTTATLYVGGGITLDSSPELEWQETKNKMATMLSVLAPMLP